MVPDGKPGCLVAHLHPRSVTLKLSLTSEEETSSGSQKSLGNNTDNKVTSTLLLPKKKHFQKISNNF